MRLSSISLHCTHFIHRVDLGGDQHCAKPEQFSSSFKAAFQNANQLVSSTASAAATTMKNKLQSEKS